MLQVFYLDVTYVCNGFQVFSGVFASVIDVCFKCFNFLLLYFASITSKYFKNRSGCYTCDTRGKWKRTRGKWKGTRAVSARALTARVTFGGGPLLRHSLASLMTLEHSLAGRTPSDASARIQPLGGS